MVSNSTEITYHCTDCKLFHRQIILNAITAGKNKEW